MKEFSDNNNTSIDKLFNDTFSQLPEDAAPNGWDTPSDAVWQKIEAGRYAQTKGGSNASIIGNLPLIGGALMLAIVAAGLFWLAKSPSSQQPKEVAPATKSIPAATIPAVLPNNAQEPTQTVTPSPAIETPTIAKPLETKAKKVGNKKAKSKTEAAPVQYNTEAKKEYPNNLERLKSKKSEDK